MTEPENPKWNGWPPLVQFPHEPDPKLDFAAVVKKYALEFANSKDDSTWWTLKSGVKSSYYFDCRKLTTHSEGLFEVIKMLWRVIPIRHAGREYGIEFDAIGGPCTGADYLVGALLYNQGRVKSELRGFGVRSESKDHGNKGLVFGSVLPGDKVVVLEDVTTSGGSLWRAIEAIQDYGCEVVKAISLVDREMGAQGLLASKQIDFYPILTIGDLNIDEELESRGLI
jgi:orotate phosphoribosyltransferase